MEAHSQIAVAQDYMHARYYNLNLGRFLSVDPVGGTVGSSQSWNMYSYVLNNPLNFVDPFGLEAIDQCTETGGGVKCEGEIEVTATDDGITDRQQFRLWAHQHREAARKSANPSVYSDPNREMLRVAGGGRALTQNPTMEEYWSWFWSGVNEDLVRRGVVSVGARTSVPGETKLTML